jgi:hypothetical protein
MLTLSSISSISKILGLGVALIFMGAHTAEARNETRIMPVDVALNSPEAKQVLDGSVTFYFGDSAHPAVEKNFGNFTSNKKTNSFGKSDDDACTWVLLSALKSFQDRANNEGGDAVINLKSYYKRNEVSYDKDFECHAGSFVAGIALKGDVVKLRK